MNNKTNMDEVLNDDQLRDWFTSRDPNREKTNPFLDADLEESITGKASSLKLKEQTEDDTWGISYSAHSKHVRDVGRHFFFIGAGVALIVAIIMASFF